jgi:hypothetical protein
VQEGALFRIASARYLCKAGVQTTLDTTATVYEIKATSLGLEGRWFAGNTGGNCREDGKFSAVYP